MKFIRPESRRNLFLKYYICCVVCWSGQEITCSYGTCISLFAKAYYLNLHLYTLFLEDLFQLLSSHLRLHLPSDLFPWGLQPQFYMLLPSSLTRTWWVGERIIETCLRYWSPTPNGGLLRNVKKYDLTYLNSVGYILNCVFPQNLLQRN
jgi:hypothetical protein